MRLTYVWAALALSLSFGCGDDGAPDDAPMPDASTPGDPDFIASCSYVNGFAEAEECREYAGAGWNADSAAEACADVFLGMAGELSLGERCEYPNEIGRCVVGDVDADGYLIIHTGEPADCGGAQSGCETFGGGTFLPSDSCTGCTASGDEGPGAIVPTEPDCREPLAGSEPGLSEGGQVCTPTLISASTEPGRRFSDYADCDVVRTQRPYYEDATEITTDPSDPRLDDDEYMAELGWVKEQAEASACVCCHSDSGTPDGPAVWNTEAGDLWIDTVSDEALAMFAGFTPSDSFGYLPPEENNGFDRSTTGLPTTDVERLRAFAELELDRRGLTVSEAEELAPFAPQFQELIDYEPEPCEDGIGIAEDGTLTWNGGGARYVWVLEADSASPGVPPNWDLPEGTIWALKAEYDADPISCGMSYGEVGDGQVQRVPADGSAPPELVSGETYYLAAMRDLAQPITRCLFTAP